MVLGRATGMRGFDTCSLSAFCENQGTDNGSSGAGPGRDWETTCTPNSFEPHQRHCGGMGFMYLNAAISRGRRDPRRSVRLLVDTGAWYSMVPRSLLQRLGVKPQWRETLVVADGRPMERYLAEVVIHYRGMSRTTPVVFAERGDATVLGAYTLEGLTLEYDPRTGRLKQMKVIPMYAGTPETAGSAEARAATKA